MLCRGGSAAPGGLPPGVGLALGVPLPQLSPAVALPVPVAVSTAELYTLSFSDVIFKTSYIACLLGHCWQYRHTHRKVFVLYTCLWAYCNKTLLH